MTTGTSGVAGNRPAAYILYQLFKYGIYALLAYNLFLFFEKDLAASAELFRNGIPLADLIPAYAITVDIAAWLVLLLLFEAETYIVSDETLKGPARWTIRAASTICYAFILHAWYGYLVQLERMLGATPNNIADACALIGTDHTYLLSLGDYLPIDSASCAALNADSLFQIPNSLIVAGASSMQLAQKLAWIDVINATTWLLIVAILEFEIYVQLMGRLRKNALKICSFLKIPLYGVLFFNAIYWGINGEFLDFWDAFLWLLAFMFIEANIFEWRLETSDGD